MSWKRYRYRRQAGLIQEVAYNKYIDAFFIIEYGYATTPINYSHELAKSDFLSWTPDASWNNDWIITDITDKEVDLLKLELL